MTKKDKTSSKRAKKTKKLIREALGSKKFVIKSTNGIRLSKKSKNELVASLTTTK